MTFDIVGYMKHINLRSEAYAVSVFEQLTSKNPKWIEKLKKDPDLFDKDGLPLTNLTKEQVDQKVKDILEDVSFQQYEMDVEKIYETFIVTKEQVTQFIIE